MNIGVIGSGRIGATVAGRLVDEGHEVAISNSRGPETLQEVAAATGARAATVEETARFGDLVVEAIPLHAYTTLPADALAGKVVVDAANYYPGRDGKIDAIENGTSSSTLVAQHLTESKVVKAFNTMQWENIRDRGKPAGDPERLAMPVAGDDEEAKRVVVGLIDQIGFDAVDAGTLADSSRQEPGTPVYGALATAEGVRHALASSA
jgi:8-hydroxy-5-deazaflavin:NADPH oxidoreductase